MQSLTHDTIRLPPIYFLNGIGCPVNRRNIQNKLRAYRLIAEDPKPSYGDLFAFLFEFQWNEAKMQDNKTKVTFNNEEFNVTDT